MADPNKLYTEYKSGTMDPRRQGLYLRGVESGQISLPQGVASLNEAQQPAAQPVKTVSEKLVTEYKAGTIDKRKKELLERGVKSGQVVLPETEQELQQAIIQPQEKGTFKKAYEGVKQFGSDIKEQFTGEARKVPETEAMNNITLMPEMNSFSLETLKNVLGTMVTDPDETAKVIKSNSPEVAVRKDEKGNYIFKSAIDGKEYAHKPGFRESDIPRTLAGIVTYAFGTKGTGGLLTQAGKAAATQAGIEGSQALLGGEFDPEQIPIAAATEFGGGAIAKGMGRAKGAVTGAYKPLQETVEAAEKAGVTPMTSDVFPPKTFTGKTGQAVTERIPIVGTGPVRVQQQARRVAMIKDTLEEFGVTDKDMIDAIHEDLSKTRSAYVLKNKKRKSEVIERLSKAPEEPIERLKPKDIIQGDPVNVDKTVKAFDDEINQFKKTGTTESNNAAKILEEYKTAIQGKDLAGVEAVRKEFGGKIKDQGEATRSALDKSYNKLYGSLREDMGDYIKQVGEPKDYAKWRVANRNLSKMINEEKNTILGKMLSKKGKETPEVIRSMLFSKKPSEIKRLYRNLSKDGKSKAKIAVLQDVLEKSQTKGELSTAKFRTNLEKMQKQTGIFFNSEEREILQGIKKSLDLTQRAETAGLAPPTGVQNFQIMGAMGLGALAGGEKGAAIGLTAGLMSRAYESKPVRNILIKLSKAKPGQEQKLIKQLTNALQVYRQSKSGKIKEELKGSPLAGTSK